MDCILLSNGTQLLYCIIYNIAALSCTSNARISFIHLSLLQISTGLLQTPLIPF